MDIELLKKYVRNECTPEELEEVLGWMEERSGTLEGKFLLSELWRDLEEKGYYLPESEVVDYERILDRIHHEMNLTGALHTPVRRGWRRRMGVLMKVAAVLFVPLLLVTMYLYSFIFGTLGERSVVYTEVVAPYGSRLHLDLPDGSHVWLNNGSRLRFPLRFHGKIRRVELEGEAYFEVHHNTRQPFVVDAGGLEVVAVGTSFDVMAYPGEEDLEVTLKEGKVLINKRGEGRRTQNLLVMQPRQHAVYRRSQQKLYYVTEDPDKYISWTEGRLIFRNDPLDDVIRRLSRWYNVDIEVEDPRLHDFTYTATFVDESLVQVLDLLKIATPIDYTIIPRKKLPDGSFTRGKVIITYSRAKRKKAI